MRVKHSDMTRLKNELKDRGLGHRGGGGDSDGDGGDCPPKPGTKSKDSSSSAKADFRLEMLMKHVVQVQWCPINMCCRLPVACSYSLGLRWPRARASLEGWPSW